MGNRILLAGPSKGVGPSGPWQAVAICTVHGLQQLSASSVRRRKLNVARDTAGRNCAAISRCGFYFPMHAIEQQGVLGNAKLYVNVNVMLLFPRLNKAVPAKL